MFGGDNRDELYGGEGNDRLDGGDDNDELWGGSGDDVLIGGAGNDLLDGGTGADRMVGGLGDDTYTWSDADDVLVELPGEGFDTLKSYLDVTLDQSFEVIRLMGDNALNATGSGADNSIGGNDADNIIDGGAGADAMTGLGGNDTYYVDNSGDKVIEAIGGGVDTIYASASFVLTGETPRNPYAGASVNRDPLPGAEIEFLIFTGSANLEGTGNELANNIAGNAGNNRLSGGEGDDLLNGGEGRDWRLAGKTPTR